MQNWQFNVLFWVGVGGAIILLLGPEIGLDIDQSPIAVSGVGAILTYVLTYKKTVGRHDQRKKDESGKEVDKDGTK